MLSSLLIWILRARDFRENLELMSAGLVIGMLIVIGWYVTSGSGGLELMDELEFMDERPFFTGAQSLTFIGPTGHIVQYLKEGLSSIFLTFGVATILGVVIGSFLYTLIFRKVRIEWFVSWHDFLMHAIGALLMGVGGVLAMGCTIGQGITGMSTLSMSAPLVLGSIFAGAYLGLRYLVEGSLLGAVKSGFVRY